MRIVALRPHSVDVPALAALDATTKALRGGGPLALKDGEIWVDFAGFVYAKVADPGFVVFAVKRQGYALDAFDVSGVVQLPEEW